MSILSELTAVRADSELRKPLLASFYGDPDSEALDMLRLLSPPGEERRWARATRATGGITADYTWAKCGAMHLSGHAGGSPAAPLSPIGSRLRGAILALAQSGALHGATSPLDIASLLCARAQHQGWTRQGRRSANGSCRLLRAADGWFSLSLARQSDLEAVPAIIEGEAGEEPWLALERHAQERGAASIVNRAQLLGVPASVLGAIDAREPPVRFQTLGERGLRKATAHRVVDLSALWAGPLCAKLLGGIGCEVIKVESSDRPDGARSGGREFYDWLHHGHRSVCLELNAPAGRHTLRSLLEGATVVIEGSRPRALDALGITPGWFLAGGPGRLWISLTGYGRSSARANWVAFGDDAAVAGGLVATDAAGDPVFCADAIADPLSGMFAGIAGIAALAAGGGLLAEVSMSSVAAYFASPGPDTVLDYELSRTSQGWTVARGGDRVAVGLPQPLPASPAARELGADNGLLG